jgi:ATP-dependent DNA helicase RecG
MRLTKDQLYKLIQQKEDSNLEFKKAKNQYDTDKLKKYSTALANEKGGKLIFGVTDKRPRQIVGTKAFQNIEDLKKQIFEALHIRVETDELIFPEGRVLVVTIPSRPIGLPIQYKGAYWSRSESELVPMQPEQLKKIFEEAGPDFSSEVCKDLTIKGLSETAITTFKDKWIKKSKNNALKILSPPQLLKDSELADERGLTYSALILFGKKESLTRYLPNAEIVFEYRSSNKSGPADFRKEFRLGFFDYYEELWDLINLRNDTQHYSEGLFVYDISTFNELVIREAILNAICHRDYRHGGSIFIRQFPRRIEIDSPGGFPAGINMNNFLWRQYPRNRRLSETFAKCGLVERAGQGLNRIFEESIKESKPLPDFSKSDDYQISLVLSGVVQNPLFIKFLEKIGNETLSSFGTQDFLTINAVYNQQPLSEGYFNSLNVLIEKGIVERIGRGKAQKYILSRKFYNFLNQKGTYTRKKGLDRETHKQLILKHIVENKNQGSPLKDLKQILPELSHNQVQTLLKELKKDNKIKVIGHTRNALWHPK